MNTANVQLWQSALVLLTLVGVALARAASALKAHRGVPAPSARAEEPASTRRLATATQS